MSDVWSQFNGWAALDIFIVAATFYYILLLVKGTRTAQMMVGFLILVAASLSSSILPLSTLHWVLSKFSASIILILVIIFQEDVRHALSRLGRKFFLQTGEPGSSEHLFEELTKAALTLTKKRIGALIVLERNILLSRYVDIGILIDARISRELLQVIFHPTSPIHDGAVIVQHGRLAAAGCFLPLTREQNLLKNWGTRHRAALGISQETDAVVLVVSEETGRISLAVDGNITLMHDGEELRLKLRQLLEEESLLLSRPSQKTNLTPWQRLRQLMKRPVR